MNLDGITHYFAKWRVNAFDIGMTTRNALKAVPENHEKRHKFTTKVFRRVYAKTFNSESNGSMMRVTPLALWGRNLTEDEL